MPTLLPRFLPAVLLAPGAPALSPPAQEDPPGALARYEEARILGEKGLSQRALPLAREALALRERALGPVHPAVARSLLQVAGLLPEEEDPAPALALVRRALAISQAAGDPRGEAQAFMALALAEFRDAPAALASLTRARSGFKACGDAPGEAETLWHEGELHSYHGDFARADARLQEALERFRSLRKDREAAAILTALGSLAIRQERLSQAQAWLGQALPLHRACGNLAQEAFTLVELGNLERRLGNTAGSLATLEHALEIFRKAEHTEGQGLAHHYLGQTCLRLGQLDRAADHYRASLDIYRKMGEPFNSVAALMDLASMALKPAATVGDPEAIQQLEEALRILKDHPDPQLEGTTRSILSQFHARAGRYDAARIELDLARRLHTGAKDVSGSRLDAYNLALVLLAMKRPEEALPLVQEILALERKGGARETEAIELGLLARVLQELGRYPECVQAHRELVRLQEDLREGAFPVLSEGQQMALSRQFSASRTEFAQALLAWGSPDPQALRDCFGAWLAHKGAVLGAQERLQRTVLRSEDPQVRARASALEETRRELSALAGPRAGRRSAAASSPRLQELRELKERQEQDLAKVSALYGSTLASRNLEPERWAKDLPRGSAFLDFAHIPPYAHLGRLPGPGRYAVFLVRPGRPWTLELRDLGPAEPVDAQIRLLDAAMTAGGAVQPILARLYRQLIHPLEPRLKGARSFIISPAGALNLLPFELLGEAGSRPLMDRGPVSYLTAGRDLSRFRTLVQGPGKVAILAAPDFDLGRKEGGGPSPLPPFGELPGTRAEAAAIAGTRKPGEVLPFLGAAAGESGLLALKRPWVLHLATHGYQLPPDPGSQGLPMLRHGLALAGANAALQAPSREGLLCAEKVLGMDLSATTLVVLSACGSGLGEIQNAEGVFGLRRAFILAGAQTVVTSLWPVPDRETRFLMARFYREWGRGRSKARALIMAKRALRARQPHPRFWGAFVLTGNPR